jgi:hypothetical protein
MAESSWPLLHEFPLLYPPLLVSLRPSEKILQGSYRFDLDAIGVESPWLRGFLMTHEARTATIEHIFLLAICMSYLIWRYLGPFSCLCVCVVSPC